jgi:uncharacterized integral membrane protein (TIGR00697 family)
MSKTLRTTLAVVFGVSLAIANVTASKLAFFQLPVIGGVAVPAGFVAIGVAFLCSDLLAELYGRKVAHRTVNATVVALAIAYALVYVSIWMPTAPFYPLGSEFTAVLGAGGTIVAASIITTLVSQHVDVTVFHRLMDVTNGQYKFVRNLGSTGVSQLVDTTLFIVLGFVVLPPVLGGTTTPLVAIPSLIIGQYMVKLVVAAFDTPLFYVISGYVD